MSRSILKEGFYRIYTVLVTGVILVCSASLFSQIPKKMSYQGVLRVSSGEVVPDGSYPVTCRIFDQESGGSALWVETQTVTMVNGLFNIILGEVTPIDIAFTKPLWLEMQVASESPLSPRVALLSAPYSLNAAALNGYTASTSHDPGTLVPLGPDGRLPADVIPSSAGDGFSLPYSGTLSNNTYVFQILQTGAGRAGVFKINNSANFLPALSAETNGGGHALSVLQGGTGQAGHFEISDNNSNSSTAVEAVTRGKGRAGHFQILDTTNDKPVIDSYTTGKGQAGWFGVDNVSNSKPALEATTNGTGPAIKAVHSGSGHAAELVGDLHVDGNVTCKIGTKTIPFAPHAFGIVNENGVVQYGTDNFIAGGMDGWYTIQLTGRNQSQYRFFAFVMPHESDRMVCVNNLWHLDKDFFWIKFVDHENILRETGFSFIVFVIPISEL